MTTSQKVISNSLPYLTFTTSRSSGAGGQHVNKVETRVTLFWNIKEDETIKDDQKKLLLDKLQSYISKDGIFSISSQRKRSQLANKRDVVNRWKKLVELAFVKKKTRKPTRPTKESQLKNKKNKQRRSEVKAFRKKPDRNEE